MTLPFTIWSLRGSVDGVFLHANAFMSNVQNDTRPVWLASLRASFGLDRLGPTAVSTPSTPPVGRMAAGR